MELSQYQLQALYDNMLYARLYMTTREQIPLSELREYDEQLFLLRILLGLDLNQELEEAMSDPRGRPDTLNGKPTAIPTPPPTPVWKRFKDWVRGRPTGGKHS